MLLSAQSHELIPGETVSLYWQISGWTAAGGTTCTRGDLFGRVRRVIPPTGPAVSYRYDLEDQLMGMQRGGATTVLSYDLGGGKLGMSDGSEGTGESLSYSYHPQAALKSVYSSLSYYYVQNLTYGAAGRVELRTLEAANLASHPLWQIDQAITTARV